MSASLICALILTVILLVITTYFFLGSMPLLVLRHDTPMDARFVRGFFNTYYVAVMFVAGMTGLTYAFAGRFAFAIGAAAVALLAAILRTTILPRMDALRSQIQVRATDAITGFRRVHVAAIAINLAQLVAIVSSLIAVSVQMR
jgi:hypothetical protein